MLLDLSLTDRSRPSENVEGSSRLTPEDIPDETGSTDEDVPAEDPADTTDQDDDQ